jgi:hypothetical protein
MDAWRDDGGEGLTNYLTRERTLSPDQAPARSNGNDSPTMRQPAAIHMPITHTTTSSSSSSNIDRIFVAALKSYKVKTGKDLKNHDLFKQLETCDSPAAILAVFQAAQFDICQTGGACRLKKWLLQTLEVLCAFSDMLGEGVSSVIINSFAPLSTNKC